MISIALAFLGCIGWGIADFLGGLKSRTIPLITVLLVTQTIGLVVIVPALLLNLSGGPTSETIIYGMIAGSLGLTGLVCLYRGMAIGPIGIVSLIASMGVILPIIFDLLTGNRLSTLQIAGIVCALGGIFFLTEKNNSSGKEKRKATGILFGFGAAFSSGLFLIALDTASNADPYWATFFDRIIVIFWLTIAFSLTKPGFNFKRSDFMALFAVGSLDAVAIVAFAVASTLGMISIISVIVSLYPIIPILLAGIMLKEKLTRIQIIGVIVALTGIIMVSIGT
ncbi:MAG: DMT family transporter [Desulfobacterales bacterium]|nr:DMT family transporter [Desulfobacterales bacterium]